MDQLSIMKRIFLISFVLICPTLNFILAQKTDIYDSFLEFSALYNSGDFIDAEKCMLNVLDPENNSPKGYLIAAYNNLGLVRKSIGLYSEALNYYNKAESLSFGDDKYLFALVDIYNNKSRIYTFQRSFSTAVEYLEKAIRICESFGDPDKTVLLRISRAYLNIGIIFYESGNYKEALKNLEESLRLKVKNKLPEIELTYLSLAKTYAMVRSINIAEDYFKNSINSMKEQFGENYYRMAEIFFDYGIFLRSNGKLDESLDYNHKALSICRKNYGEKHPYVSLSLRNLGDYYLSLNNYDSSLYYYQRSLISIVNGFSETDIFENPLLDFVILNVDLLKTLRKKSAALELLSGVQDDPAMKLNSLNKSLETIELALQLIDRIRNDYLTEESRIYLADNEKETYVSAVHVANSLYDLTGENSFILRMYSIVSKAKSAVLRNEITENELFVSAGIPDSLGKKQNTLSANIAAYNNLILGESQKKEPDSNKISLWKDVLFEMNREKERISTAINNEFPQLKELLRKTEPLPLVEIQRNLRRDETIIDYLLSNEYNKGKRNLYAFIITRDNIEFFQTGLDSLFIKSAEIIRNHSEENNDFSEHAGALYYMYDNLIKPVEGDLSGHKLIFIPDEEISWLPFDAFLMNPPDPDQSDYEGLLFLIRKYAISYAYSSSLIYDIPGKHGKGEKVSAFAPDYSGDTLNVQVPGQLQGAGKEIESVLKWFKGDEFTGSRSTEHNFRASIQQPAIFHLAMHSVTDTLNSKYSWLAFDAKPDTIEDGRLYNYEISLIRIVSPMVVLSACNSGTGTLYHGEGLMSMARSFVLSGASSVVRTSWEVNDETSAGIIISFYHYLSKGMRKNEALRKAKLDYLEGSVPALSDPYYWAAYEVLGDNSPVKGKNTGMIIMIIAAALLAAGGIFYLRRRRIFSACSE